MEIRLVKTEEEKEAVYRFRYQIYIEEMRFKQFYADRDRQTIREPLDEFGYIFIALQENKVVGTVRVNYANLSDLGYYLGLFDMESVGHFHPQRTSITTKLIVSSEFRSTTLAVRLVLAAYQQAIKDRIKYDFIECKPNLVNFFLRIGYKLHKEQINHPDRGKCISMILNLEDFEHFERIGSPFLRVLVKQN
ncbi:hypothetical protein WA1_26935 [Scytonema hofmannii PCC 7110]|uniref:N-acetyltransferase domain-containing protein n=1 Tax=Scytonema hofmannii PCC 7110 TaxID=128403 RepID=A0A139X650_9CYAN|nr:GNAT family N-acetyltransferase [Scytonema hofmannii]KYC40178.1 hypothetical protein WA1_26935 [Scytonema hofmannii PCC 7110]